MVQSTARNGPRRAQAKTEQEEIQTYCERVMEEVEEELQTLLYEEKLKRDERGEIMCYLVVYSASRKQNGKKKEEGRRDE